MLCKYYDFLNLFPAAFQKTFTESDIFSSIESGTKTQTSKNIGNNNHLEEHCNVVNISCVVDISSVKIFTISMLVTSCGSDGVRAGVRTVPPSVGLLSLVSTATIAIETLKMSL